MIYLYILILIFFIIFTIFYSLSLINNIIYKVPQVSTFNSDLNILRKVCDKYLVRNKKIVDLWSWTWKMLRFFEREYKMKVIWFEIDISNVIISKIINKLLWYKNITTKRKNYFDVDLSDFDFIYIYLFPVLMKKVEEKIWNSAKPWTIIIVNAFKFEKHKPIEIFQKNWKDKIFVYKI